GSSLIVVGRAITKAENPVEAYKRVVQLWEEN
ncbi:orotidine-5'-phosphate decarboxylase, partial [Butyricicoccus sp. 1XD8-22]